MHTTLEKGVQIIVLIEIDRKLNMTSAAVRRAGSLTGDQEEAENDIHRATQLDYRFIVSTSLKNCGLNAIRLNQSVEDRKFNACLIYIYVIDGFVKK